MEERRLNTRIHAARVQDTPLEILWPVCYLAQNKRQSKRFMRKDHPSLKVLKLCSIAGQKTTHILFLLALTMADRFLETASIAMWIGCLELRESRSSLSNGSDVNSADRAVPGHRRPPAGLRH